MPSKITPIIEAVMEHILDKDSCIVKSNIAFLITDIAKSLKCKVQEWESKGVIIIDNEWMFSEADSREDLAYELIHKSDSIKWKLVKQYISEED